METENVLGFPVTVGSLDAVIEQCAEWLQPGSPTRVIACANPHSLIVARRDSAFRQALLNADLLVPDGAGIVLASMLSEGGIRARITGSDIFMRLCDKLNRRNARFASGSATPERDDASLGSQCARPFSVFLLGATPQTLDKMAARMRLDFPHLILAGSYSPPFRTEFSRSENQAMMAAVNAANPDVLWVGMTAPKQEKWLLQHREQLNVRLAGAIGAVFDFYAGNVRRSPIVFQRFGLEWLPRLMQEPRRLWRRNLDGVSFMARVLLEPKPNQTRFS